MDRKVCGLDEYVWPDPRYEKFVQIWQHLLTPLRPLV
jgi:hypothetical protein